MALIVVGCTTAAWVSDKLSWLRNAEQMRERSPVALEFFAAIQVVKEDEPALVPLMQRVLEVLPGDVCTFDLRGLWTPDTHGRLVGITTGRNLVREYVLRDTDASHVLYLDADVEPDPDCIAKLLEVDHPVVGGHVGAYCLSGPRVIARSKDDPLIDLPVEEHWNTAGFLLVRREVLADVAWRWNPDGGLSDDPCFAQDADRAGHGKTWVRKDCVARHASLVPVERRK